ncbi:MAG TPA: HNH endonuclease signature motif containing protein [Candidatus Tumulicola sp.]|jgi:5-methylcytosine-specific restriction endonuclease McrA
MNDRRRRYDWQTIQTYYEEGHSYRKCASRFGFCAGAWQKAVRRGEIKPRLSSRPLTDLLGKGKSRTNIKRRLLAAGIFKNMCSECSLQAWLGQPLTIQIDHINGVRNDHRLENLRMLCPNCHSQTETYGKRNSKRAQLQGR